MSSGKHRDRATRLTRQGKAERLASAERDALTLYRDDIPAEALLTAAQEIALGLRIQAGDTAARDRLVEGNLRLVISVATYYAPRTTLPLADLIQEGNIGLMRAAVKYDPTKINPRTGTPFRFTTYATWWIRQAVTRALLDNARPIRLPIYLVEDIMRMRRGARALYTELGREATPEELGARLGIAGARVRELQAWDQQSGAVLSLDAPLAADEPGSTLSDVLVDEREQSGDTSERAVASIDRDTLYEALRNVLSKREVLIIALRFGLGDGIERTLDTVGTQLGITRERVRQIEARALDKMRAHLRQDENGALVLRKLLTRRTHAA